jgi:hypothetical protein
MNVKVFNNGRDLETEINKWIEEVGDIEIVNVHTNLMHDLFCDGTVCNQWYAAMIFYNNKEGNND